MMRAASIVAALLAPLLLHVADAFAQAGKVTDDDLYRAETIVTGTGEEQRLRGFRAGAEEAVIKLTADAELAGSARISPILDRAAELVADYTYEDRMKGIPIHDEQGTRDRPHFLRIRFDKGKFDAALQLAGLVAWNDARPVVAVWLGIRELRGTYVLAAEGPEGYGQREVLKDASKKRGVPIILPPQGQSAISYDAIAKPSGPQLQQEAEKLGATGVLYGTLDFDGNVAWNTHWTVSGQLAHAEWSLTGVTFDVALKAAIERTGAAFAKAAHPEAK